MRNLIRLLLILMTIILTSCATIRSEIKGKYEGKEIGKNTEKPVKVLFLFTHVSQTKGFDTVPKIDKKYNLIRGFNDIFSDALREINNISQYDMFTDDPDDVNDPKRRKIRDSLMMNNDYSIHIRIEKSKVFSHQFFATLVATSSATLIPVPYKTYYHLEVKVYNKDKQLIYTILRDASITKWVQPVLIVFYPFYPEERKKEEIYLNFLHDTFKEIENSRILK